MKKPPEHSPEEAAAFAASTAAYYAALRRCRRHLLIAGGMPMLNLLAMCDMHVAAARQDEAPPAESTTDAVAT